MTFHSFLQWLKQRATYLCRLIKTQKPWGRFLLPAFNVYVGRPLGEGTSTKVRTCSGTNGSSANSYHVVSTRRLVYARHTFSANVWLNKKRRSGISPNAADSRGRNIENNVTPFCVNVATLMRERAYLRSV